MEEKNSILGEKNVNFGGKKSILGENVNFKVKSQFWERHESLNAKINKNDTKI